MSRLLLVLAVLGLVSGCKDDDARKAAAHAEAQAAEAAEQAAAATAALADLKVEYEASKKVQEAWTSSHTEILNTVSSDLSGLMRDVAGMQLPRWADLRTADKNYSVCITEHGSYAVAIENVVPYLDGYRLLLKVGNLTSAGVTGGSLLIRFNTAGPVSPERPTQKNWADYKAAKAEWEKKERGIDPVKITDEIPAGHWGYVIATVTGVTAAELSRIRVLVMPDGIVLNADPAPKL